MKIIKSFLMLMALCVGLTSVNAQDIVSVATENEDLTTLSLAIEKAGLTEALQGAGPFTVFAPKNSGFADLSKIRFNTLMQAGMENHLKELLSYHVVEGKYTEEDLRKAIEDNNGEIMIQTLAGYPLTAVIDGSKVEIINHLGEKSEVEKADVQASNGIVHIIDEVLIPKEMEAGARQGGYYSDEEFTSRGAPETDQQNQDVKTQDQQNQDVQNQDRQDQDIQNQDVRTQDVPTQDQQNQDTQDQPVQNRDVPTQDVPTQDVPTQDQSQRDNGMDSGASSATGSDELEVRTMGEMLNDLPNTTIAAKAFETVGLMEMISEGDEPKYTLFIPTDEAFTKVPKESLSTLMEESNREKFTSVLKYHLVDNHEDFAELMDETDWGDEVKTYNTESGEEISLQVQEGKVVITDKAGNKAHLVSNINTINGQIYLIDHVLFADQSMNYQQTGDMNNDTEKDKSMKDKSEKDKSQKKDKNKSKQKKSDERDNNQENDQ